jgi:hypothetical protein
MSEIAQSKTNIEAELQKILQVNKAIDQKLDAAKSAGDDVLFQSLIEDLKKMKSRENELGNEYANLVEKEKKPELERISGLRKELAATLYPSFYEAAQGGADVVLPRDLPENQVDPVAAEARKYEIVEELFKAANPQMLPAGVRFGVGALPTPESELEYLQQQYPDANVTPVTIGGSTKYVIKTKDGKTFTTIDMGLAGLGGAAAVEAPIVLGSTAAGIATALATKSPGAGTAAAAGAEAGLGVAADAITRAALGMNRDFSDVSRNVSESVVRRGSQAAIGAGLGVIGDVAIPAARAFRVPRDAPNLFREELFESAERSGLPLPPGTTIGPEGLRGAQELAGDYPRSRLAGRMRDAQLEAANAFDPFRQMATRSAGDYASVAFNQAQKRNELTTKLAQNTGDNKTIIDGAVKRLLDPPSQANVDQLGGALRGTIQQLEEETAKFAGDQYALMGKIADDAGFEMSAKDALAKVQEARRNLNASGFADVSGVEKIERDLIARRDAFIEIEKAERRLKSFQTMQQRAKNPLEASKYNGKIQDAVSKLEDLKAINRPLNFKDFNELIKRYGSLRSENLVGASPSDIFGTQVSNELSALRSQIFKGYNMTDASGVTRNLADEFRITADAVAGRNNMQKNTLGSILKEAGGESVATQRDVVRIAMKDPETMDRVLRAAQDLDVAQPGASKAIREGMQAQYMQDIGMGRQGNIDRLNYDPGKLDILFGADSPKIARGLDTLNEKLSRIKGVTISDITRDDLTALSSALSKRERNELADKIIKREAIKKQENELVNSAIFDAATKGNFDQIDPDLLSAAIFSGGKSVKSVRDVEIAMAQLSKASPDARNLFKRDFLRMFLDRYKGGKTTAAVPFKELFDVDKFLADYGTSRNPTELGKKMNIVLGQDAANQIYDIARIYQANTIKSAAESGSSLRIIASSKDVNIIAPISKLTIGLRNRILAESLANESTRAGLRNALAGNALSQNANDAYLRMFQGAFATRQGLTSLARQVSGDEELSYELEQAAQAFAEKEQNDPDFSELNRRFDLQKQERLNSPQK